MASLPVFFHDAPLRAGNEYKLDEDTARHVVQVLRKQPGDQLRLTDGKGNDATASIISADKRRCSVMIDAVLFHEAPKYKLHLGIAFTKNSSRNEWLLEKATELGVSSIIPLIATRTEREKIRYDRWHSILVSALLQSQQFHLPKLAEAAQLKSIIAEYSGTPQKLIGHCIEERSRKALGVQMQPHKETIILIGPEGDFTDEEVALCEAHGFAGISMGTQRLRTETAAMAACAYFNTINHED